MTVDTSDPEVVRLIVQMLTDTYTNPIAASVREVVSNAFDATVDADSADPVEVTLPTEDNLVFKVSDYGTGMSKKQVEENFIHYLNSTKRDNMKAIGSKGLGAKSPLAYCDSFLVETTKDNVTTIATISRGLEDNEAYINCIENSGKPNGTTVSIPVKESDCKKFADAVESYRSYPTMADLIIDGELVKNASNLVQLGQVCLDEDDQVYGRVWLSKGEAFNYIYNNVAKNGYYIFRDRIGYSLSGWVYGDPLIKNSNRKFSVIVELKPGVVDFVQSRDTIINNDRIENVREKVLKAFIGLNSSHSFEESFASCWESMSKKRRVNLANAVNLSVDDDEKIVRSKDEARNAFINVVENGDFDPLPYVLLNYKYKPTVFGALSSFGQKSFAVRDIQVSPQNTTFATKINGYSGRNAVLSSDVFVGTVSNVLSAEIRTVDSESAKSKAKAKAYGGKKLNLLLVECTSEEELEQLYTSRNTVGKMRGVNYIMFFLGRTSREEVKRLHEVYDFDHSFVDADDLLKEFQDYKKKQKKPAAKKSAPKKKQELKITGYYFGVVKDKKDFRKLPKINYLDNYGIYGIYDRTFTLDELKDQNIKVFVTPKDNSSFESAFYGAVNRGEEVFGSGVLLLTYDRMKHIEARTLAKLDESNVFFNIPLFYAPSYKVIKDVKIRRSFSDNFFQSDLVEATLEELVYMYLTTYRSTGEVSNYTKLASLVKRTRNDSQFSELIDIASRMRNPEFTLPYDKVSLELANRRGNEFIHLLQEFREVSKHVKNNVSNANMSIVQCVAFGTFPLDAFDKDILRIASEKVASELDKWEVS